MTLSSSFTKKKKNHLTVQLIMGPRALRTLNLRLTEEKLKKEIKEALNVSFYPFDKNVLVTLLIFLIDCSQKVNALLIMP